MREGSGEEHEQQFQDGFVSGFHSAYQALLKLSEMRGRLCACQLLHPQKIDNDLHTRYMQELADVEHKLSRQLSKNSFNEDLLSYRELLQVVTTYLHNMSIG